VSFLVGLLSLGLAIWLIPGITATPLAVAGGVIVLAC
jgi:hypothetical protein